MPSSSAVNAETCSTASISSSFSRGLRHWKTYPLRCAVILLSRLTEAMPQSWQRANRAPRAFARAGFRRRYGRRHRRIGFNCEAQLAFNHRHGNAQAAQRFRGQHEITCRRKCAVRGLAPIFRSSLWSAYQGAMPCFARLPEGLRRRCRPRHFPAHR